MIVREDSKRFIVLNADIYGAICSLAPGGTRIQNCCHIAHVRPCDRGRELIEGLARSCDRLKELIDGFSVRAIGSRN